MWKQIVRWLAAAALVLGPAAGARGAESGGRGAEMPVVEDVRVEAIDQVPVSAEQVLGLVSARAGKRLDRAEMSGDVRRLQESGMYSYAEVRLEEGTGGGVALLYRVRARPVIRKLRIDGADYLGNPKVRELMDIRSGSRVDDSVLGKGAEAVKARYRKSYFPSTKVTWTLTSVEDDEGRVDVDIRVDEGRRAVVRKIRFEGVKHVKESALREVMQQKESTWLSWITNDGMFEPGALPGDRELVRKALMDRGYLGARVAEPTFEYVGKKKMDITFKVEEGPLYKLAGWSLEGEKIFGADELSRGVAEAKDGEARMETIRDNAQNIRDYYGSRGYIRTGVTPKVQLDTNAATATVTYEIEEGKLAYIRNIDIRGNTRTKDKVIRREIAVAPGDVYNEKRVRTSENRVRNLNYFSYVGTYPEPTDEAGKYDLVMEVEEQQTGMLTFGVGFSSVDNVVGYAELRQGNFDLLGGLTKWRWTGGGQKFNVRGQIGDKRSDVEVSWTEPWFLDKRLSLGVDLFRRDARYYSDDYDQTTTGGAVTLGHAFFPYNRLNWTYGLEDIDISDVSEDASQRIKDEEGGRLKSYGQLELVRDTRDHVFLPTRGFRGSVAATLAGGPFGGETDTYGFSVRLAQHFPLWFGHVLSLRGSGATVEEYGDSTRVPIFDRTFMGGPRSVRAFKYHKVGPKDENKEALGGRSSAYASAEYTFPIVKMIRGAVFYDGGIVWQRIFEKDENDPAVGDGVWCDGYGIGIRFDIPQFPIQLDYAWPIDSDDMLGTHGRFSFNIGYSY